MNLTSDKYEAPIAASVELLNAEITRMVEAGDGFLILSTEEMTYCQTSFGADGFMLEKQDGSLARHYMAELADGSQRPSREDVEDALIAYFHGAPFDPKLTWTKMSI